MLSGFSISRTKPKSHIIDAAFLECSLAETLIGAAKGLAIVEGLSDLGDLPGQEKSETRRDVKRKRNRDREGDTPGEKQGHGKRASAGPKAIANSCRRVSGGHSKNGHQREGASETSRQLPTQPPVPR
jgi:hypothetical protein